jgi:PHP family Zn ribbon phosphoesterase
MLKKLYYDLHLHSCLSPCGDNDNTPCNIAGMASLCGLNIAALTDHNTTKNCPAFFEAARNYGIIPVAGMELTTSEDIHAVCLFENLDDAVRFDEMVSSRRILIKNKPEFFGEQLILDSRDNLIGSEEYLLSNATDISIDEIYSLAKQFGGVAYPAHIDRDGNSITAVLGTIPEYSEFDFYELHFKDSVNAMSEKYGIDKGRFIVSSDAHYLTDMRDKDSYLELDIEDESEDAVRRALFKHLRGEKI